MNIQEYNSLKNIFCGEISIPKPSTERVKIFSKKLKKHITIETQPDPKNARQAENIGTAPSGWW